jgi:hypothetical protein
MSVLWTIGLTFAFLLVVAIPIAGLAGRGRRRIAGLATPKALPADGTRRLDPGLEPIEAKTRALLSHAGALEALRPAYVEALPLLEVMAAARSSPRVYPSQWVGETNDAFNAALSRLAREVWVWLEEWEALPGRVRAELREGAEELLAWCEAVREGGALVPSFRRASTFSYLDAGAIESIHHSCAALERPAGAFLRALSESSSDPYR